MTRFIDKAGRIVEVEMIGKNEIDWSDDFYETGLLELNEEKEAYAVDDVEYCIGQAMDWKNREGDYSDDCWGAADEQEAVYVTWITEK